MKSLKTVSVIIALILSATTSFAQVSRNRLKQSTYSWINRQVATNAMLDSTFRSFWNIIDDGVPTTSLNVWGLSGNAISTNTNFIGPTSNRSFLFYTNNLQRMKLDSLGILNVGPVPTNTTTIGVLRAGNATGFTDIGTIGSGYGSIHFSGNSNTGNNYALAGDGLTTVLLNTPIDSGSISLSAGNAATMFTFNGRCSGRSRANYVCTSPTRLNIPAAANSPNWQILLGASQYSSGIYPTEYGFQIVGGTHSGSASSATITTDAVLQVGSTTTGTNMTITNPYSALFANNVGITSHLEVGGTGNSGSLTSTLNVTGNAKISTTFTVAGASALTGITNTGTLSVSANSSLTGVAVSSTLNVAGNSALTGVTNTGTMSVSSTATVTGNLTMSGTANTANKIKVGATSAPSATLDVAGTGAFSQSITTTGISNTGSFSLTTAGNQIVVKEGANAMSGTASLSSGSVTIANTNITTTSRIIPVGIGTTSAGFLTVLKAAATGFTITSSSPTDARVVDYIIITGN